MTKPNFHVLDGTKKATKVSLLPPAQRFFYIYEQYYAVGNLLKEVHRVLRPEGKVIITVDNLHAIARIWKRGKWQGFREETHLYLFTPSSLKFLLERSGFEVARLETPFNPLPKSLRRLVGKTGLGGQIWLAARK